MAKGGDQGAIVGKAKLLPTPKFKRGARTPTSSQEDLATPVKAASSSKEGPR